MNYAILQQQEFQKGKLHLVPLRKEDIFLIMRWRNEQLDILRQKKPLTEKEQAQYYLEKIVPSSFEKYPEQILFSLLVEDQCIGYGGLVHIDWENRRAEVSFLLNTDIKESSKLFATYFSSYLEIIQTIAFQELKLHKLTTETFDIRPQLPTLLEKNGFLLEGRCKEQIKIRKKFVDSLLHGLVKRCT